MAKCLSGHLSCIDKIEFRDFKKGMFNSMDCEIHRIYLIVSGLQRGRRDWESRNNTNDVQADRGSAEMD